MRRILLGVCFLPAVGCSVQFTQPDEAEETNATLPDAPLHTEQANPCPSGLCGPGQPQPKLDLLVEISAGPWHTCARKKSGKVFCWGAADAGQAGTALTTFPCIKRNNLNQIVYNHPCVSAPTQIAVGTLFKQVDAGRMHTCAITSTGAGMCWGNDGVGQIGIGNGFFDDTTYGPTLVDGGLVFSSISAGNNSSCGTTTTGRLFCWAQMTVTPTWTPGDPTLTGAGPGLGAGLLPSSQFGAPAEVLTSGSSFSGRSGVSVGHLHGCMMNGQTVECWGENDYGETGVTPPLLCPTSACSFAVTVPPASTAQLAGPALRVSTEEYFTCADLANGTVQCFGVNDRGQLGSGTAVTATPVPQTVGNGMALHGVTTGSQHACALDPTGAAFCWGINKRAQLGNGGAADSSVPVAVSPAADGNTTYSAIAAGGEHTCAIGTNNHIYCWGDNAWGQQGNHFGFGNLTPNLAIDP